MSSVLVLMTMAMTMTMMIVPLMLGVGAGYLALEGMLSALKMAGAKTTEAAPAPDNVIVGSFGREPRDEQSEKTRIAA